MNCINLYQTVDDRDNADDILNAGPICCKKEPWLGEGYYFWEGFIDNAHWWGRVHYKNKYSIFKVTHQHPEFVLNLIDNTEHMKEFRNVINSLKETYPGKCITASFAIEYLKRNHLIENFMAVKANGINSKSYNNKNKKQIVPFNEKNNKCFLELVPPIQICVFNKNLLNNDFEIVYPKHDHMPIDEINVF